MVKDLLLVDQGNTRLKWMRARNHRLLEESAGQGDFNAFSRTCSGLKPPEAVLLSSVADSKSTAELVGFCRARWNIEPRILLSAEQGSEVKNGYEEPARLGVDRWLAIVGAVAHHGKPVVVWDLGTATTIDAVDADGLHIGGMIYPGPATMLNSLGRDTRLGVPEQVSCAGLAPGRSTANCVANGVFAAQVGALNQFMRAAPESLGENPKLVVTGGAASEIVPLLDFPCIHDPVLVFRGMLAEGVR